MAEDTAVVFALNVVSASSSFLAVRKVDGGKKGEVKNTFIRRIV